MPTIQLSSALASTVANRMLTVTNSSGLSYSTTGLLCNTTDIYLCQGVKPAATPTLTQLSTNQLVLWYHESALGPTLPPSGSSTVTINTNFRAATASGTATWFCVCTAYSGVAIASVTGTVGAAGSGADLEIFNTSIVSGNQYRISSLILTLPSSWSY